MNDMTKGNDWFLVANDFATYMKAQDEVDAVSQGVAVAFIGCMLAQSCKSGKDHLMPAKLLLQRCLLVSALGKGASAYFGQSCISH